MASAGEALRLRPDLAETSNNLASILQQQGRLPEAEGHLRRALLLKPESAEIAFNLGIVLRKLEKVDESIACSEQAIRLKPDYADAHASLGSGLTERGQLDEAIAAYRVALQLKPDAAQIHSSLIWSLHYHPTYDAQAIQEECRRWNSRHAEPFTRVSDRIPMFLIPSGDCASVTSRRIFASMSTRSSRFLCCRTTTTAGSRSSATAHVAHPDAMTERLRGYADVWRNTSGLTDQAGCRPGASRPDRHLVDLKLHTADNRLLVFARKPAPVQVVLAGISRNDWANDHRLPSDRSLPRSAGAFRRLVYRKNPCVCRTRSGVTTR